MHRPDPPKENTDQVSLSRRRRGHSMRIVNRSHLEIDRQLWRRIAAHLNLDSTLPASKRDSCDLFTTDHLRVFIHAASNPDEAGSYSCGRMDIFTCPDCTEGRLLWVYCHELIHAWFDSYKPKLYFDEVAERAADKFADTVLRGLGGRIRNHNLCGTYRLATNHKNKSNPPPLSKVLNNAASLLPK